MQMPLLPAVSKEKKASLPLLPLGKKTKAQDIISFEKQKVIKNVK